MTELLNFRLPDLLLFGWTLAIRQVKNEEFEVHEK